MKHTTLLALILAIAVFSVQAQTCPLGLAGALKVGPGGNYLTLQSALSDLRAKGLAGPVVLELQAGYTSAGETFPLVLDSNVHCSSRTKTITIRPAAGAGQLSITSADP